MRRAPRLAAVVCCCLIAAACSSGGGEFTASEPDPSPVPTAGGYTWSDAADMPTERTEVAVTALDDDIYAIGGFVESGSATRRVERFDGTSWHDEPQLPHAVHHAGAASIDGRVYVVGGFDGRGEPTANVWSLGPRDDDWREEPDLPTARGALAVAVVDGRIHAVGGSSSFRGEANVSAAHEEFDPRAGRWNPLPDLPFARDHLAAAADDGVLYVVGGRELSLTSNTARLDIFADGQWIAGPDMPTARGGLAAAASRGRILVFGGEQPQGTFPQAEAYDIADQRWLRLPDLPTPRHGLGSATLSADRVYVVGGGPEPGLTVSGATEVIAHR